MVGADRRGAVQAAAVGEPFGLPVRARPPRRSARARVAASTGGVRTPSRSTRTARPSGSSTSRAPSASLSTIMRARMPGAGPAVYRPSGLGRGVVDRTAGTPRATGTHRLGCAGRPARSSPRRCRSDRTQFVPSKLSLPVTSGHLAEGVSPLKRGRPEDRVEPSFGLKIR